MAKNKPQTISHKPPLGQHFLFDEKYLNKIVDIAQVSRSDVIVEIGPGKGSLTQKLAMRARKVIAFEFDRVLAIKVKGKLKHCRNLEVINADILRFFEIVQKSPRLKKILEDYKVIGNIPYYITGKILRLFTQNKKRPKMIALLVQKEVGERVCAKPGKMSILSVAVQTFGQPRIVGYVPREVFSPPPDVDSAILRIDIYKRSKLANELGWFGKRGHLKITAQEMDEQEEAYFRLIKIGFSAPRKQIHNNLCNGFHLSPKEVDAWLSHAEIKKTSRPQELGVEDWISLFEKKGS